MCDRVTRVGDPSVTVCGGCSVSFHCGCLGLEAVKKAPYYCIACRVRYKKEGILDAILQRDLIDYLYEGVVPDDAAAAERCRRTAIWMKVSEFGDLYVQEVSGRRRIIPLIGERLQVLADLHAQMCYCSGKRLYYRVAASYYWRGLRK